MLLSYVSSSFCSLLSVISLSYYYIILFHHPLYSLTQCFFPHHSTEATLIMVSDKFLFLNLMVMSLCTIWHSLLLPLKHSLPSASIITHSAVCLFFNIISMTIPFILLLDFPFFPSSFHSGEIYLHSVQSLFFSHSTILRLDSLSLSFQSVHVYWLTDLLLFFISQVR